MNKDEIKAKLEASGLPSFMVESMLKQLDKPEKKKAVRYFPGAKKKELIDVEVTIICDCCGATETQIKQITALPDSPKTMKTVTALCNKCPDFFRALTHEELVRLALVRHHPGIMHFYKQDRSQVKFAKKHTAEEIINLKVSA